MDEITARRWSKTRYPSDHQAIEALEMALYQLRSGEITADHVIVCIGTTGEQGAGNTRYLQSGNFTVFEQLGLMHSAMHLLMRDN